MYSSLIKNPISIADDVIYHMINDIDLWYLQLERPMASESIIWSVTDYYSQRDVQINWVNWVQLSFMKTNSPMCIRSQQCRRILIFLFSNKTVIVKICKLIIYSPSIRNLKFKRKCLNEFVMSRNKKYDFQSCQLEKVNKITKL